MPRGQYNRKKVEVIEPSEIVPVNPDATIAVESTNEALPIQKPTLPDKSSLSEHDRLQSLVNLMKQLPRQYWDDPNDGKKNLWAILRFEPTDEQISAALEVIANEPERNQR
jgi:hypothetical protein